MDWVKEIFTEATEDQMKSFKDALGKQFIPKTEYSKRVDSLETELKETQGKLQESSNLVKELNEKAGLADEYKTKASEWETKYKEFETETEKRMINTEKRNALSDLLDGKMPKSAIKLVLGQEDLETVSIKDGKISNVEDLMKSYEEKYNDLLITETSNSQTKNENTQTTEKVDDSLRTLFGLPPTGGNK